MVHALSSKITSLIKDNVEGITEEKMEVINYGISLIITELIFILVIFSIAGFLGIIKYVFISFMVFGALRVSAGGSHARSRPECIITYSLIIFGTVYLSEYLWADSYYPAVLILIINLLIIFLYAPGDTVEKPILSRKMKKRLKITAFVLMVIFFAAAFSIWFFDKVIYNIIVISTIPVMFFLTPAGYRVSRCKRSCEANSFE